MPDKPKKIRLYKFASEYNLSTESVMEFLSKKDYEIKSHMTLLSDEMIADINDHFKKDIEKAEIHYRKISEFQKKRGEKSDEENVEESVAADTPEVKTTEEAEPIQAVTEEVEKVPETEDEETVTTDTVELSDEQVEEAPAESVEESVPEAAVDMQTANVDLGKPEEAAEVAELVKPEDEKVEVFRTKAELEIDTKQRGLKILGKVELGGKRKPKNEEVKKDDRRSDASSRPGKPRMDKDGKPIRVEEKPVTGQKPVDDDSSDAAKRKKKKMKAKKKPGKAETLDEIAAKKKKKGKKLEVDKREVDAAIKRTMLSMDDSGAADRANVRKKKRKEKAEIQEKIEEQKAIESTIIKVNEFIAVSELANIMNVTVAEVISKCIGLGLMVSINQRLDFETITLIADDFGFEVELEEEYVVDALEDSEDATETLTSRPPVVTIMGHVDHGKTSLLDYIRRANVVAGESGGITQHIGAYQVETDSKKYITFLDTPGHEAFTAMRARGAKVTDIVVLIVAADDAVMPQTIEAINHAKAANVPIIIAINKIDKPGSNVERIRQQLADRNVLVEEWGGKYQCVEVSAKQGLNIDVLLEKILLEAEMLDLKANADRKARGAVIESKLEPGRGVTATILIEKGTMHIGDPFVAGNFQGRVRAMFDERNNKIESAGPAMPVLVLGFESSPQAGDSFIVVDSEREARDVSLKRQQLKREQDHRQVKLITLDEIASQISRGGLKELPLLVKGDVDGSVEALADSLMKLSNEEVQVKVISRAVGAISESDVLLAAASGAIIIGFHVRPNTNARKLAEVEKVDIRLYNVIYDAIAEVKSALEGMLSPIVSEEAVATVEVREIFKVPKIGTVAGCYVQEGKITRHGKIRLFRDGIVIYEGELSQLRRFKDDVKDVDAGYECGLNITNFNDIKVGDIIESYKLIETKKKLD
ncbi:MAG: translation initiation factor IF-2 [Bacteroidetes bacterium]|nr:translation initiation factor IF-2 [Bacteroidota bacterium]